MLPFKPASPIGCRSPARSRADQSGGRIPAAGAESATPPRSKRLDRSYPKANVLPKRVRENHRFLRHLHDDSGIAELAAVQEGIPGFRFEDPRQQLGQRSLPRARPSDDPQALAR